MSETSVPQRILFVCLGNICRSPTAEGMLRQRLAQLGLEERVEVDSCGTGAWHVGDPPDPRAIEAASARGIDISGLRGRQLASEDFATCDEILVMDAANLADVAARKPANARAQVLRLMAYAGQPDADVPDPYFGGEAGFLYALDQIEAAVDGVATALMRRMAVDDA
ncbi:low molecular weight protein-tyrosine-phosphatase [Salinicola aestuarinus]|uniref:low molecular weight protein-tyrosine-phosphatase n=1 Tax=Salinicola aestuarinus TaxID=1949082 RepID=UPI000DA1404C|nr:low molecular weight protein-tyrosine-phosphatase [Salinicola aestuarinus]